MSLEYLRRSAAFGFQMASQEKAQRTTTFLHFCASAAFPTARRGPSIDGGRFVSLPRTNRRRARGSRDPLRHSGSATRRIATPGVATRRPDPGPLGPWPETARTRRRGRAASSGTSANGENPRPSPSGRERLGPSLARRAPSSLPGPKVRAQLICVTNCQTSAASEPRASLRTGEERPLDLPSTEIPLSRRPAPRTRVPESSPSPKPRL
jgi:hypothetical protein